MKMLIVESAAKARTIQKYLKGEWAVLATGGHVQDLPSGTQHGKAGRKATFAEGPDGLPRAPWVWTDRGEKAFKKITDRAAKDGVSEYYLATDPDREGEFIAWRLEELLSGAGATHRVTFQEVTIEAIKAALQQPRDVDMDLVRSASVRKFLDRFVGFRTSKVARAYLAGGGKASMGRVQTPTLGFIVERELEREAHIPIPFFEVRAQAEGIDFQVRFHEPKDPAAWRDDAGKSHPTRTSDGQLAQAAFAALRGADVLTVMAAKPGKSSRKPKPALSTDALLQAAGNRWGWSPGRTMREATGLYEAGHISYIRTDSTRLSEQFIDAARTLIATTWGDDHLGPKPSPAAPAKATSKAGSPDGPKTDGPKADAPKIQDAHEAIRPTHVELAMPEGLEGPAAQLYQLVRAHAIASQMGPARFARVSLTCGADGMESSLTGGVGWRTHAGWQAAFAGLDKTPAEAPPALKLEVGQPLAMTPGGDESPNPRLVEDATKPPGRFRAHTVVRQMKDNGIGRPSTYASTVETLKDRRYVDIEDGALVPTPRGRALWLEVAPLYDDEADGSLFSVAFTSDMENQLDRIESGDVPAREIWARFRDSIRSLHNTARGHMNSGLATPKRVKQLEGLLAMAPSEFQRPADLGALTQQDALAMITELRESGVQMPPSEQQLAYIRRMGEALALDDVALGGLAELPTLEAMTTTSQASALIEVLQVKMDSERPASPKQLGMIRSLAKKLGLEEGAAAALVGAKALDELSGGRSGTASGLIDALQAKQREAKKAAAEAS